MFTLPASAFPSDSTVTTLAGEVQGLSWADATEAEEKKVAATSLMKDEHDLLVKNVRAKLSNLVFRRVKYCYTKWENLVSLTICSPDGKQEVLNRGQAEIRVPNLSQQQLEQHVIWRYKYFHGVTVNSPMAEAEDLFRHEIHFHSKGHAILDPETFEWSATRDTQVPPRPDIGRTSGDLICGLIGTDAKGQKSFVKWFICSEQFYRMWLLCMFPDHEAFSVHKEKGGHKAEDGEAGIRHHYFKGNRLCTANYKKWWMTNEKNPFYEGRLEKERLHRFWVLRTEPISQEWVHTYAAIALLVRYNELPTKENVPRVHEKNIMNLEDWHLPEGFLSRFIANMTRV